MIENIPLDQLKRRYEDALFSLGNAIDRTIKSAIRSAYVDFAVEVELSLLGDEINYFLRRFSITRMGTEEHLRKQEAFDTIYDKLVNNENAKIYIEKNIIRQLPLDEKLSQFEYALPPYATVFDAFSILQSFAFDEGDEVAENIYHIYEKELNDSLFDEMNNPDIFKIRKKLKKLIPAQKIAPVQFDIRDNVLVVTQKGNNTFKKDKNNIEAAKNSLLESGESILNSLSATNCDRRLMDAARSLHSKIKDNKNIIEVGLFNSTLDSIQSQFEGELPDVLYAQMKAHSRNVNLYIAQFPEWRQFSDNAALIELNNIDIDNIRESTSKIVNAMEKNSEVVDQEAPKTIRLILSILDDPKKEAKKAAFALLRTVENIFAKIFEYGIDFIDGTVKEVIQKGKKAAAITLIGTALAGTAIIPVASKLNESAWLSEAIKIIQKEFVKLSSEK